MDNKVFTYHINKDDKVFIYWNGKPVMILKDREARKFIHRIEKLNDDELQLVMAKVTGNFKRGNER